MTSASSSSYTRVTIPSDGGKRIISVGFNPMKDIQKYIDNGRFIVK
ncbi:MAG: hypothetical protein ACK5K7_01820 [Bacilli bacterium]